MDGNKDDALKCLKIGKDALDSGDKPRAFKFLTKARRLDPTLPLDDLFSSLGNSDSSPPPLETPLPEEPKLRNRSKPASSSATCTEDQITIVREINKKKDYYEILGLERTCSVEDIRKAYRKLSLKVHPDKNKASGSEEAFKSVSKAFQCLSNDETRKKYDLTGSEEVVYERRAPTRYRGGGGVGGYNGYYDEFDPDEIFRQFFFGGMAPASSAQFATFNFGGNRGGGGNGGSGVNLRALIQLLPVLVILLFNFLPSSEPVYALSGSYPYQHRFTTQKGVNFYVKDPNSFEQDYPVGSRERLVLEGKVERDYVQVLTQNCRLELQRQQWGFIRETPHCQMLQQFKSGSLAEYSSESAAAAA